MPRKEYNVQKYIQWVTNTVADNTGLSSFIYLLLPSTSAQFCEILQKFELIVVEGHPRSSILVSIEST